MLVGDSLSRYMFDELLAWLHRMGRSLRCVNSLNVVWHSSGDPSPEAVAVDELASADRYERWPVDCRGHNLRIFSRRMNLLPPSGATGAESFYDALFAPVGRDGIVVIHLGLWVGALARHAAFARYGGRRARQAAALSSFQRSVRILFQLACRKHGWPRIVWRMHLPQHFATPSGEYAESGASRRRPGCRALGQRAAHAVWDRLVAPVIDAAAERGGSCTRSIEFLRGFWPMVERHDEHPGNAAASGHGAGANRSRLERADCTHWLPCSSAMNLQLRLLLGAVSSLSGSAHPHQRSRVRA